MDHGMLSVVLPAHNEVGNLVPVIDRALTVLPELFDRYEIVVVDDGSTDGTADLADRIVAEHPCVRVIHHQVNRGYGAALVSGFGATHGDYVMFMDADQQFDIADLALLAPLIGEYDIVAGYRLQRQDAAYRRVYAEIFRLAMWVLFGVALRDIDCAFKVIRGDLLRSLTLTSPGALINTEIMAKAAHAGATWIEVGVNHYPRASGQSSGGSPRVVFRAMRETVQLWLRLRREETRPTAKLARRPSAAKGALVGALVGTLFALGMTLRRRRP